MPPLRYLQQAELPRLLMRAVGPTYHLQHVCLRDTDPNGNVGEQTHWARSSKLKFQNANACYDVSSFETILLGSPAMPVKTHVAAPTSTLNDLRRNQQGLMANQDLYTNSQGLTLPRPGLAIICVYRTRWDWSWCRVC